MLENLVAAIDLARDNPAGKDNLLIVESSAAGSPTFQTGLLQNGEIANLPYGAVLSNVWQVQVEGGYFQVGAGTSPDNPTQGSVYVLLTNWDKTVTIAQMILADETSGPLSIIEVSESQLVLQSESGRIYHFNLGTWELSPEI